MENLVSWIATQKVMNSYKDRSITLFVTLFFGKILILVIWAGNPLVNGFYMKINLSEYVLTIINMLEGETNTISRELDILCFNFIICTLFSCRCSHKERAFFATN